MRSLNDNDTRLWRWLRDVNLCLGEREHLFTYCSWCWTSGYCYLSLFLVQDEQVMLLGAGPAGMWPDTSHHSMSKIWTDDCNKWREDIAAAATTPGHPNTVDGLVICLKRFYGVLRLCLIVQIFLHLWDLMNPMRQESNRSCWWVRPQLGRWRLGLHQWTACTLLYHSPRASITLQSLLSLLTNSL